MDNSSEELNVLVNNLPYPISLVINEYLTEKDPYIKLHRLIDASEIITRFFTVILLCDLKKQVGFSEKMCELLAKNLEQPTFGQWAKILKDANNEFDDNKKCFIEELPEYINRILYPALDGDKGIIELRNSVYHSGRITLPQSKKFLEEDGYKEKFENLASKLDFLSTYKFISINQSAYLIHGLATENGNFPIYPGIINEYRPGENVYILNTNDKILDLYPLNIFGYTDGSEDNFSVLQLYSRFDKSYLEFLTFSDKKSLYSEKYKKTTVWNNFLDSFPLKEWQKSYLKSKGKNTGKESIENLIQELTEVFVGRKKQEKFIKDKINEKENEILWIRGSPGIGKSGLIAKLAKDYESKKEYLTIPYFFRSGNMGLSTIEFLNDGLLPDLEKETVNKIKNSLKNMQEEPVLKSIQMVVKAISDLSESKNNKKILFFVDGLDEIYRTDSNIVEIIEQIRTATKSAKVIWVLAGQPDEYLEKELREISAEFLPSIIELDKDSIQIILERKLGRSKYELFKTPGFVDSVFDKSKGLPLYIHMLIEDIRKGKMSFDKEILPEGLDKYYSKIFERIRVSDEGRILTPVLCFLALSKEPLTDETLSLLLSNEPFRKNLDSDEWNEIYYKAFARGSIVLRKKKTGSEKDGWTLNHDTFHQKIFKDLKMSLKVSYQDLLRFCKDWENTGEKNIKNYALKYYPEHLYESKNYLFDKKDEYWKDLFDVE